MNSSLFESKYDNEFIGLLNEIGLRIEKFNKCDKLKIKSWINVLMMKCVSNEEKKNRNLYAILLINQMIKGKLEEPFIKFVNTQKELLPLSAVKVKEKLTREFYDEIDFQKIENFGYMKQKEFLMNHPDIAEQVTPQTENNIININNNYINENNMTDYNLNNQRNKSTPNFIPKNKINNKTNLINSIDNKQKIFIHLTDNSIDDNFYSKKAKFTKPYNTYEDREFGRLAELDINTLKNIIIELKEKINKRDEIISYQENQIEKLKELMNSMEKKFK